MPRRWRISTGRTLFLLSLVLLAAGAAEFAARPDPLRKPPVPVIGAYLGAYVPSVPPYKEQSRVALAPLEAALGRTLAIDQHFFNLLDAFPDWQVRLDGKQGRLPLITWQPKAVPMTKILAGQYDDVIRGRARDLRAYGSPVFLRWAAEMNGDARDGIESTSKSAPTYIAVWQRLHRIFQSEGATNVAWVWCPNHVDVPSHAWNHWTRYYPGDAYVDWVGVDGFNGGSKHGNGWRQLNDIVGGIYRDYSGRKPIMIAETSSVDDNGRRAEWIDAAHILLKDQLPGVKALLWFDKPPTWQLEHSPASLSAFARLASDAYFSVAASGGGRATGAG